MKNLLLILAFLISGIDAWAAAPARGSRGGTGSSGSGATASSTSNSGVGKTVQRGSRGAPGASTGTGISKSVGRSAIKQPSTTQQSSNTVVGRSAAKPTVAARAAKQNVINSGTKVTAATQNTVVDEECWNKFSGCMDSFCMLDNATGGRCICSDKNAEYDAILAEIQDLDNQSYQMATVGVERIEMGDDADVIMAKTKAITNSIEKDAEKAKSKRQSLDLSAWSTDTSSNFDEDVDDIFSLSSDGVSVANKKGDALYRAAAKLCVAQIPECKTQDKMMELMYQQRIRSDCTAYENSLRQQRTQSAQKLASAQSAMREAALEQYRNANKYDLGQCTIEFKKCMQTTAGCGDDFTGCITQQTTRQTLMDADKVKQKKIKGASTTIEIAAWSYDALESKKPLCMSVTQQCVNVKNQVWDTFLREVAPQVKSAELMAESNMRMSCISTISDCFQKACKENMDPNDPDGSYDMCLTRPDTLRSFCKVQIDPCEAAEPKIMDYVRARLASMRVDSCTKEFKDCLQSEDRCGADYTQCIGLDTDTIVNLCPAEKLVGCQYEDTNSDKIVKSEDEIYQELARIAQGIFLSIDNNILSSCQKAVQEKVIEICGSLSECDAFAEDEVMGTDSLVTYRQGDDIIIDGLMNFGLLKSKSSEKGQTVTYSLDRTEFDKSIGNNVEDVTKDRINSAIQTVENRVIQKIDALGADPTIDMCVNGRSDAWRYSETKKRAGTNQRDQFQRFPNILDSYAKMIFTSGLDRAYLNYRAKYDEVVGKALEDQSDDVKSAVCSAMAYQEGAPVCTSFAALEDGTPVCDGYKPTIQMENIFGNTGTSKLDKDGTRYIIHGADLSKKLQALSNAKGEFIQTDGNGNMVGSISITSTYSPGSNICTVTTTTTMCSDLKMATTTDTYNCGGGNIVGIGGGCGQGGVSIVGGYGETTTTQNYHGVYCSSYGDPVITTTEIKM